LEDTFQTSPQNAGPFSLTSHQQERGKPICVCVFNPANSKPMTVCNRFKDLDEFMALKASGAFPTGQVVRT
jgi:hypothetical protein